MLKIVGTVPEADFPLTSGVPFLEGDRIRIGNQTCAIQRGTLALVATASIIAGKDLSVILVGDTGRGDGSRRLYNYLVESSDVLKGRVLVFHYLLPDADWHGKIVAILEQFSEKPFMIADAGFMYAAKMTGHATFYDLFTPDLGELAFLADEEAPHPFYTRGFLLHEERRVEELIERAYRCKNVPRYLIVKASKDYVVDNGSIVALIDAPSEPAMEGIGGTGDTLTGIIASLVAKGMEPIEAITKGARINRLAGALAKPSLRTPISEIMKHIPSALESVTK